MNPIIKWPGGKGREIRYFQHMIPSCSRYVEPFFGGGALFFYLQPKRAAINDISETLISYYNFIKKQDPVLYNLLINYDQSFHHLIDICSLNSPHLCELFFKLQNEQIDKKELEINLKNIAEQVADSIKIEHQENLQIDTKEFKKILRQTASDKFLRTISNYNKTPYGKDDLEENLITGFANGYYIYFRNVFNDIGLGRKNNLSPQYKAANFYFVREYCYGSMFRYNSRGEFNVPYGGMSYNRKNIRAKINGMFNTEIKNLFSNTEISCADFEIFFKKANLTSNDFIFLDPPYDMAFSDYEGKSFTKLDQERLASCLKKTDAQFMLVIKSTDFIRQLYEKDFNIAQFEKQYTYNVRGRNDRNVEHLIITNYPTSNILRQEHKTNHG